MNCLRYSTPCSSMGKRHPEKQREGMCASVEQMRSGMVLPHNAYKATIGGGCLHHSLSAFRPASTNGPKNNEKKIKRLVEPIEVHAFQEMEYLSIGKSLLFVSAQAACRARKTLERSLLVVFGSVSTRGPKRVILVFQKNSDRLTFTHKLLHATGQRTPRVRKEKQGIGVLWSA